MTRYNSPMDMQFDRRLIDALPAPLFVVDSNARIVDFNKAAFDFAGDVKVAAGRRLCGEVIHCANALQSEEGCGLTDECPRCVLRNSVNKALRGERVVRQWAKMTLLFDSLPREFYFLVTATPFDSGGEQFSLVTLEDVTELQELRTLIPVCCHCGKARSDEQYWERINDYLQKHTAVQFTHCLCPSCLVEFYGEAGQKTADALKRKM